MRREPNAVSPRREGWPKARMTLSEREFAIAERYAAGETYKEIAAKLHIAPSTVRNHLAAVYRKLEVKNKPELIRALSAQGGNGSALPPPETQAPTIPLLRHLNEAGPPPVVGASIAVLPFANIGPAERDYFGHGVVADIQHELTRCHDLFVSGRSSCLALSEQPADAAAMAQRLGVQYLLQGTLRSHHDRVRLTAELIDGATGTVLWSERYDRVLGDILDIEAEVANTVATSLALQIGEAQYERRRNLTTDQLSAYDWRLRGNRLLELGGKDNLRAARDCFVHALDLEPNSAATYAGLSICFGYECDTLLTDDYPESLARHIEFAQRAVELDEADSRSHYAMVCALMLSAEFERADLHAVRALELNPSEYHNLCSRGYTLMSLGLNEDSLACFNQSLRRNPLAPNSCLMALGLIEYLEANYGQSAAALSRMTANYIQKASSLAAACAQSGHGDAARAAALEFRTLSEDVPVCPTRSKAMDWPSFWRLAYPYLQQDAFEQVLDGIGKADLPV